jgi:hypothetical protein
LKMKWLPAVAIVATLAVPAFGQINVYIGSAPPPIRYEVRPAPPSDAYQWIDGYWDQEDHGNHHEDRGRGDENRSRGHDQGHRNDNRGHGQEDHGNGNDRH